MDPDPFGRSIDYLRISVTDRCNERCLYCRPRGYAGWNRGALPLSDEELLRIARVAAGLGFHAFRLTGGESLLRPGLVGLVRSLSSIPGIDRIGITSNGLALTRLAGPLRDAGCHGLNLSLDALDPAIYRRITGGPIDPVLRGIRAALAAGFRSVKLNAVLLRGLNEGEILPLARFAAERGIPLRLIERMPMTAAQTPAPGREDSLPAEEALGRLRRWDEPVPMPAAPLGDGPAKYFRLPRLGAVIGLVRAMSDRDFCRTCNRLRLTVDGRLRPCLGDHREVPLRPALAAGGDDDEALRRAFAEAIAGKPREHAFRESFEPRRPMTAIGG